MSGFGYFLTERKEKNVVAPEKVCYILAVLQLLVAPVQRVVHQ